jgi:hypothetical protein
MRQQIIAGNEPDWITRHPRAGYVRQAYLSVPPWADRAELRWVDWCRRAWSAATGIEYTIDHEVPLNHPHVSGLTVPWNFKLVPRAVNQHKRNEWHPGQKELL